MSKELDPDVTYYKLTTVDEYLNGYKLKTGLNETINKPIKNFTRWDSHTFCAEYDLFDFANWDNDYKYIRKVTIQKDCEKTHLCFEDKIIKTNKFILGECQNFSNNPENFINWVSPKISDLAVMSSPEAIKYSSQTPERCLLSIKHNPYSLRNIKYPNQTMEMWKLAVMTNPYSLECIYNVTQELYDFYITNVIPKFSEKNLKVYADSFLHRNFKAPVFGNSYYNTTEENSKKVTFVENT